MRPEDFEDFMSFDAITQSCGVEMDPDPRMAVAPTTAMELIGENATDNDAMLFLNDIDDSWLAESLVKEDMESFVDDSMQCDDQTVSNDENCIVNNKNVVECTQEANVSRVSDVEVKVEIVGLRELPLPHLVDAGKGKEKMKSHKNNNWALRRADSLRAALVWDMKVAFGDLPLTKVDKLLANLFSRVVKIKGGEYPAESLMNMLGGYNWLLRRASLLRSLDDPKCIALGKDFNIKYHPAFVRTRLTLDAAIKKTAKDGTNKKRKKVNHITQVMEAAVLADVDHQVYHNQGCQKRAAFYLLVRCGIRGRDELWELQWFDLEIKVDKNGKEYVQYYEWHSKNNEYTLDRTKEEQFRRPYHSYEPDFVFTAKQYLRHLPPWAEGNKNALFLGCIQKPASIVWYNRVNKVGKGTAAGWLENMLKLVGLPDKLFSNKSGRATLITRLAAQGVPDHVGMLLSGHHTADGYGRYDRTKDLKQEAATLVAHTPGLNYEVVLAEFSKKFYEEDLIGHDIALKPLIAQASRASTSTVVVSHGLEASASCSNSTIAPMQPQPTSSVSGVTVQAECILHNLQNQVPKAIKDCEMLKVDDPPKKLALWNADYDNIDWEVAIQSDPKLAKVLGGFPRVGLVALGSGNSFNNCQNVHIQINLPQSFNPSNFDFAKMMQYNQENKENIEDRK